MTDAYRVQLDAFEGPLDLLLFLIRKAEVDITEIPLAAIANQYLDYVEQIDRIDIELAGEFLVMAATLMEIKSRMLQPPEDGATDQAAAVAEVDRADPRAELVRQLIEYKSHRDSADALDARRREWALRYPLAPAAADDASVQAALAELGELDLEDLDLMDLCEAFQGIIASVDFDRLGDHQIIDDDTPIELHAEDLIDQIQRDGELAGGLPPTLPLRTILAGRTRGEMIGLFLALLMLIRDQRVTCRQSDEHEVVVALANPSQDGQDTEAPPEAVEAH